jgi:hypothetical protein
MILRALFVAGAAAGALGCGNGVDPSSKLTGVRILATRADEPYARPGDVVNLAVLAYDARPSPTPPMRVAWVPTPCVNPPDDAYFACYPALAGQFPRGTDVTHLLKTGTTFSLTIPLNALAGRPSVGGQPPYGTLIVFSVACAGHLEYVGASRESPEALPFACLVDARRDVGPDGFVFAYSRIFVFEHRANENPVIDRLELAGQPVDPSAGITMDRCADGAHCPMTPLDVVVPSSSQEPDPSAVGPNGEPLREEIWVDYYASLGGVRDDVRLLYDPGAGAVPNPADALTAPAAPGDGVLFAVIHDNRGGVAWTRIPLHVR